MADSERLENTDWCERHLFYHAKHCREHPLPRGRSPEPVIQSTKALDVAPGSTLHLGLIVESTRHMSVVLSV